MRVVLRDDVAGVGRRGDIVKVAGGFARNFLLPEGRAIVATEGVEGQHTLRRFGRRYPVVRRDATHAESVHDVAIPPIREALFGARAAQCATEDRVVPVHSELVLRSEGPGVVRHGVPETRRR